MLVLYSLPAHAGEVKEKVTVAGVKLKITASSESCPKNRCKSRRKPRKYDVRNLADGKSVRGWVEGAPDRGDGQWVAYEAQEPITVRGFLLLPGYAKSAKTFVQNAVPFRLHFEVDGKTVGRHTVHYQVEMTDEEAKTSPGGQEAMECYHNGNAANRSPRVVLFDEPRRGKRFSLHLDENISGKVYRDLVISEWRPLILDKEDPLLDETSAAAIGTLERLRRNELGESDLMSIERALDLAPFVDTVWPKSLRAPKINCGLRGTCDLDDLGGEVRRKGNVRAYLDMLSASDSPEGLKLKVRTREEPPASAVVDAAKLYLQELRTFFVGRLITLADDGVNGLWLVSEQVGRYGDGEWVELYPALHLDEEGRLTHLLELAHGDGAPGCSDVLPTLPAP